LKDSSLGPHCYTHGCTGQFIPLSVEHLAWKTKRFSWRSGMLFMTRSREVTRSRDEAKNRERTAVKKNISKLSARQQHDERIFDLPKISRNMSRVNSSDNESELRNGVHRY
jgi:hypothetical protein